MPHIVAGTAGHIDHGKTALVRALTGIDTDRLEEEKRRGISIDLGFAHLELPGGLRIGFIDVPGHERFVRTMLAGVAGIDLVLFVVAADESIQPQTREHFDICRLIGVRAGIVVLTKRDLVGPDILELVRLEVDEFVAGSFLEGAPVVGVSSVTGEGLDELRAELARLAAQVAGRDASRHVRLHIDRAFSMRGFGTVVTGTLLAGSVGVEQELEVHPAERKVRVRGVQVHGQAVERAFAGQRTALNVAGVDGSELARGMSLAEPGLFRCTRQIDCRFELLGSARPLKNRAPVHFHHGTAEVEAEFRVLGGEQTLAPGRQGWARFLLRDPVLALPGDHFIVRMFSPVVTIGGGTVLDVAPPRFKRGSEAATRLQVLHEASLPEKLALLVTEARHGASRDQMVARTGLPASEIEAAAARAGLVFLTQPQPWLLSPDWMRQAVARLKEVLTLFHKEKPLLAGLSKEDVRSREFPGAPPFLLDALLAGAEDIVQEGETLRLASHRLSLKEDEEGALRKIEDQFVRAGLAVPATAEVLAASGVDSGRARSLLALLLRQKRLLRVSEDLVFHRSALDTLRQTLGSRRGQRFSVPQFKEWTGVSRKYAIPLLEFLDREHVTRREGNHRVIL